MGQNKKSSGLSKDTKNVKTFYNAANFRKQIGIMNTKAAKKFNKTMPSTQDAINQAVDYLGVCMRYGVKSTKELEEILSKEFKKNNNGTHIRNYIAKQWLEALVLQNTDTAEYELVFMNLPIFELILYDDQFFKTAAGQKWDITHNKKKKMEFHSRINSCLMKISRLADTKAKAAQYNKWAKGQSDTSFEEYLHKIFASEATVVSPATRKYKKKKKDNSIIYQNTK